MNRLMESMSAFVALVLLATSLIFIQGIRNLNWERQVTAYENVTFSRKLVEALSDPVSQTSVAAFFEEHPEYEILSDTLLQATGSSPLREIVFVRRDEPDRTFQILYEAA